MLPCWTWIRASARRMANRNTVSGTVTMTAPAAFLREFHLSGWKLVETAPGDRQGRMASEPTVSARRLHRHQHDEATRQRCRFLQQTRHLRTMDQRGQGRDSMDAAVMPLIRRQRRAAPASCARLQSRQLPTHAGDARAHQRLVADEPKRGNSSKLARRSSATGAMPPSRWRRSPFQELSSPTFCG
jgi:hypothetical protein